MTATGLRRTRRARLRLVPSPASRPEPTTTADAGRLAGATAPQRLGLSLIVVVAVLTLLGSVMVLSASSVSAVAETGSAFSVFIRQSMWLMIGAVALYVGARTDYHRWARMAPTLVLGAALALAVLLMKQPNLGTTMILSSIVGGMLLWAGVPMRILAVLGGAAALGTIFALSADYRRERVVGFLDPWENAGDAGYQTIQSLIGVASGGVSGTGLGESRAKWGFLPESHTDFVFAIIGEELGLIGALFVVGLFAALIAIGLRIARRASDPFCTMLAIGVTTWFAVQGFVNVGAVLSLLPITGVPLPFVSFGGSSLVATMLAAGVLVNVALQGEEPHNPVRARIAARRARNAARTAGHG